MREMMAREMGNILTWEYVAQTDYDNKISKAEEELALSISKCLEQFGVMPNAQLIELGSGSGHISAVLAKKGYQTTLMDFSKNVLIQSESLFQKLGLTAEFICEDIFNADQCIKMPYDIAWNSGVMEHFNTEELAELFKVIYRVTKKYYLCIVPNPESLPYLLFRYKAMKADHWLYGMEFLRNNYEKIAETSGFALIKKQYLGNLFTIDYMRYFFGNEVSYHYQEFLEAGFLPEKESYLILYFFEKKEGSKIKYSEIDSSIDIKTINFDYIINLQKNNRELLRENLIKKSEIPYLGESITSEENNPIKFNIRPPLVAALKKYGPLFLIKTVVRECVNGGLFNSIKYFKNKLKSPIPIITENSQSAIFIRSAIDLIEYLNKFHLIKGIIFIEGSFDFDPNRNQRSISLASEFNSMGYFVFYMRYQWSGGDHSDSDFKIFQHGIMQIPRLELDKILSSDLVNIVHLKKYFIMSIPDDFLLKNYLNIRDNDIKICYDIIDNWKEFNKVQAAPWYKENIEHFFINNADIVTAVSKQLIESLDSPRHIKLLSNGISGCDNFLPLTQNDQAYHVGYVGHLTDKWFNWDYIFKLAEDDNFIIHLIGEGAPLICLENIKKYKNIIFYGYIQKIKLPQYVSSFNIGLIPFIENTLAACVDPLKVYDYLQWGRPVVSTGIPHLAEYPYCINTTGFSEFKEAIIHFSEDILIDKSEIIAFLNKNTWKKKTEQLVNFFENESITGENK